MSGKTLGITVIHIPSAVRTTDMASASADIWTFRTDENSVMHRLRPALPLVPVETHTSGPPFGGSPFYVRKRA